MSSLDVAIKPTDPVRVVATSAVASGFGHENLGPIFGRLVPELLVHLGSANTRPGIMISWYEDSSDDGSVVLHAGFDIGDQTAPEATDMKSSTCRASASPRISIVGRWSHARVRRTGHY